MRDVTFPAGYRRLERRNARHSLESGEEDGSAGNCRCGKAEEGFEAIMTMDGAGHIHLTIVLWGFPCCRILCSVFRSSFVTHVTPV